MRLDRFIYIDPTGIASLYAQLRGEDVVETFMSTEHSRASGLRLAINAFIGGSGEPVRPDTSHARACVCPLPARARPGIPSIPSMSCQLLPHSLGKAADGHRIQIQSEP
jgi:hypothetical protein